MHGFSLLPSHKASRFLLFLAGLGIHTAKCLTVEFLSSLKGVSRCPGFTLNLRTMSYMHLCIAHCVATVIIEHVEGQNMLAH